MEDVALADPQCNLRCEAGTPRCYHTVGTSVSGPNRHRSICDKVCHECMLFQETKRSSSFFFEYM